MDAAAGPLSPPRLLLLHGTLCRRALFAPLARRLRPQVVLQPLGWREALRAPPSVPANVLGFSLGGLLALRWLRESPASIARLALVGSNAQAATPLLRRRQRAQRRLLREHGPASVATQALPGYFGPRPAALQRRQVLAMARRTPPRQALAQFALAAGRPASHAALAAFAGPLLLVAGARDALCPPALQRRMQAAQPRAQLQLLPRCGHFVPLEAPAALARLVRAWLASPPAIAPCPGDPHP